MRFGIAFILLLLLLVIGLQPAGARRHALRRAAVPYPQPSDALFSLRERRRVQAILRLRLLEMRAAGLERVRSVIERRLPVESLFDPIPGPRPSAPEH